MWVTFMDSPLCPGHVVVTSCFFSSVFGTWKTGDVLSPVVRGVIGGQVSLASWKLQLCVGDDLYSITQTIPAGLFLGSTSVLLASCSSQGLRMRAGRRMAQHQDRSEA